MSTSLRVLCVLGVLVVAPFVAGSQAEATHTVEHAKQQIQDIQDQTVAAMDAVVAQFAIDAPTAATEAELDAMHNSARAAIDSLKNQADDDLTAIKNLYPELASEADAAKTVVSDKKRSAKIEIDNIEANTDPGGGGPTTTTTTTTVPPTTTTTTVPPTTTTTTVPPTTTTLPATVVTSPPPTTTTTTVPPSVVALPGQPTETGGGGLDPSLMAMPLVPGDQAADRGSMVGMLDRGMSVVLPDGVVTAVLSPLIVIEILAGTLFSSLQSLAVPGTLLLVFGGIVLTRSREEDDLL